VFKYFWATFLFAVRFTRIILIHAVRCSLKLHVTLYNYNRKFPRCILNKTIQYKIWQHPSRARARSDVQVWQNCRLCNLGKMPYKLILLSCQVFRHSTYEWNDFITFKQQTLIGWNNLNWKLILGQNELFHFL